MLRPLLLSSCLAIGLAGPVLAQDAADIVVRLNRVENVSRQLSGQIEQLQYENRQLKEQLRKFQEDVEFRLQEGKSGAGAPPPRAPAAPAARKPAPPPAEGAPYGTNPGAGRPERRGDAFDPERNPNAPGAPRRLGEAAPSAPIPPGTKLEMQVVGTVPDEDDTLSVDTALSPPGLGGPVDLAPPQAGQAGGVQSTGAIAAQPGASVAATGTGDARADYDAAYALVMGRQYEAAEMSLRQFIQSHPRDRLVPRATYWLGESYLQRNRSREAAEQFLKVSTDHAGSVVAPDAMLKLGIALDAIGAKAQACATLAEVERKFPGASANVRQGVEREMRRARCAA